MQRLLSSRCWESPAAPNSAKELAGISSVEDGRFVHGRWMIIRHLNGDETHQGRHVRIPPGDWGIQRVKLYRYR